MTLRRPDNCSETSAVQWNKTTKDNWQYLLITNATSMVVQDGLPFDDVCRHWKSVLKESSVHHAHTTVNSTSGAIQVRVVNTTDIMLQFTKSAFQRNSTSRRPRKELPLKHGGESRTQRANASEEPASRPAMTSWRKSLTKLLMSNALERVNWTTSN